jgi:hypothetical protein
MLLGATYVRNVVARSNVRDAKKALGVAQKGRWSALRKLSLVVACLLVVILAVRTSYQQLDMRWSPDVSQTAYAISVLLVALGGWLVLRYVANAQAWKTAADRRKSLAKARQVRAGTILPLLLSVTIFIAALYAVVTTVG